MSLFLSLSSVRGFKTAIASMTSLYGGRQGAAGGGQGVNTPENIIQS